MRIDYPNARGTLSTPLPKSARTVQFDADLEALLSTLLEGQYTYLKITNDYGECEVVVLTVELGQRVLYRAKEYTCSTAFQQGDTVEYVFTTEHADNVVNPLTLFGTGAATVEGREVGYTLPSIEHVGSAEVVGSSDIVLGRDNQAYGCCDGGADGAVSVGEPYIYLTSRMYPTEMVEPGFVGLSQRYTHGVRWDMTVDALRGVYFQYLDATMYGGYEAYTLPTEDAFSGPMTYLEATIYGSYGEYVLPPEDAFVAQNFAYIDVNISGNQIVYTHYVDDAFAGSLAYTEGTIT